MPLHLIEFVVEYDVGQSNGGWTLHEAYKHCYSASHSLSDGYCEFILDLNSEPCPTAMRCSLFLASSSEVGGEN